MLYFVCVEILRTNTCAQHIVGLYEAHREDEAFYLSMTVLVSSVFFCYMYICCFFGELQADNLLSQKLLGVSVIRFVFIFLWMIVASQYLFFFLAAFYFDVLFGFSVLMDATTRLF